MAVRDVLFGYPVAATEDNWLHEAILEMVRSVHQQIDAGNELPPWPNIIPDQYRVRLRSRSGIRTRLVAYGEAIQALGDETRARVLRCVNGQNDIARLLCCEVDCERITDLPNAVQIPIKDLFDFAYKKLSDFGIRDAQYTSIYQHCHKHVCPFCGFEFFDAPGAPREHLDHYLAKSLYPAAAANLRNLVPMGPKCNASYKLAQDILYDDEGNRRQSFDPYTHGEIEVQLVNSVPFEGDDEFTPRWTVEFVPDGEECSTWDVVFKIRERYVRDILNPCYKGWLSKFTDYCRVYGVAQPSDDELIDTLVSFIEILEIMSARGPDFLQGPVFHMIKRHIDEGDQRLRDVLRDLATVDIDLPNADAA